MTMNAKLIIGLSIAAVVAIGASVSLLSTNAPLVSPLYISHAPLVTAAITPTITPSSSPSTSASQAPTPTPTPTPAPTIIPGARPTDWKTYRNYEWQFEIKIPPNWTVDDKYGIVISGDNAAIRIDTDGVGPDGPGTLTTSTRTVAGQQVDVADGTFFSLKRDNADIPYYWFRINNWTDSVDKILSTFKSW